MTKIKKIDGFDGYYITDTGKVMSEKTWNDKSLRWIKPAKNRGYLRVTLHRDGKMKCIFIHRLVAEAFIPNPDNKPCVDHINCDRTDNRVENLRWCTYEENMNNPITRKRESISKTGDKNPFYNMKHKEQTQIKMRASSPFKKSVIQRTLDGSIIFEYDSASEAARQTGIDCSTILKCCREERNSAGGFKWSFKNKDMLIERG